MAEKQSGTRANLFDLRLILAVLFVVYGAVLTIMGLLPQSAAAMSKTGGWNVNLWVGIAMLIVAGIFAAWRQLRPLEIPAKAEGDQAPSSGH